MVHLNIRVDGYILQKKKKKLNRFTVSTNLQRILHENPDSANTFPWYGTCIEFNNQ